MYIYIFAGSSCVTVVFSQNRALNAISMASGRARPTVLSSYVIAYKDVIRLWSSHRPCLLPRTCTLQTDFQCLGHSYWQNQQKSWHWKYPDGALQTVKKCSVKRWTLLTLNGRHLGYVAEEEQPFRQLFSLESWLNDASQITSTIIAGYNNGVIWWYSVYFSVTFEKSKRERWSAIFV